MSGNVHTIEEYLQDRRTPDRPPKAHSHAVWTLSATDIAAAQGFAIACRTTSREQLRPLEFEARWVREDSREGTSVSSSVLKPQNLLLLDPRRAGPIVGTASSKWEGRTRSTLDAMTWAEASGRSHLRGGNGQDRTVHPEVSILLPGDVIDVQGSRCVVLSNTSLHKLHWFGPMLVAPLRRGGAAGTHCCAVLYKGDRIAFEEIHTCEPIPERHRVARVENIGASALSETYAGLASLNLVTRKPRVSRDDLLKYLTAANIDRGGLAPQAIIPHIISGPVDINFKSLVVKSKPLRRGVGEGLSKRWTQERYEGDFGTLRVEFWSRADRMFLRINAEGGKLRILDQVSLFSDDPLIDVFEENVPLAEWFWEIPIGSQMELNNKILNVNAVADGITLTLQARFALDIS